MATAALVIFSILVGSSLAYPLPLDIALTSDISYDYWNGYYGNYYAPCIGLAACKPFWLYDRYGLTTNPLDTVSSLAVGTDLVSPYGIDYTDSYGYLKIVGITKENFVRGYGLGVTEVGTRNQVSLRPSVAPSPYSNIYSSYFPFNYLRSVNSYPLWSTWV